MSVKAFIFGSAFHDLSIWALSNSTGESLRSLKQGEQFHGRHITKFFAQILDSTRARGEFSPLALEHCIESTNSATLRQHQ